MNALLGRNVFSKDVLIVFFSTFLITGYIALVIFADYPVSADEYNYWYQAQIFAQGKRFLELPHPEFDALLEIFMINHEGRVFSKYTPGNAMVMTLGAIFGQTGLINPLLSGLTASLLYGMIKALYGYRTAISAILIFISNSYFLGYAGSYFSQPLSLLLTASLFLIGLRYFERITSRRLLAAGAITGFFFWVRPVDAACALFALGCIVLLQQKFTRQTVVSLLLLVVPAIGGVLALFIYNWFLINCFCITTYPVWHKDFNIQQSADYTWRQNAVTSLMATGERLLNDGVILFRHYFFWIIGPSVLLLATLGALIKYHKLHIVLLLYMVLLVLLYGFHKSISLGWPQYGSRYWYPALIPLLLLAAAGLSFLQRRFSFGVFRCIVTIILMLQIGQIHHDFTGYQLRISKVHAMYKEIEDRCPVPSFVILGRRAPADYKHAQLHVPDMRRNPFFYNQRLYVKSMKRAEKLKKYFPDYGFCEYP